MLPGGRNADGRAIRIACRRCAHSRVFGAPGPRAFTLIEIVVTLSLLGLLTALAWPLMQNQIAASAMPESASRMRDTLFLVRSHAMMEHRRVRLRFAPDERQPHIEIETDPIREPGKWEAVAANWAREPILLDEMQVHTIEMGRPVYLKPIAFDTSADQARENSDEQAEQEDVRDFDAGAPPVTAANEDIELDENRPLIIYDADGSTEWATVKLAEIPLEKELQEEDNQLWVILDGRTGLAYVREQVTEEQLADENFYVKRENLEPPDTTSPEDLAFNVQNESGDGGGGNPANPGGSFGANGGNLPGNLPGGMTGGVGPGALGQIPGGAGNGMGGRGAGAGMDGGKGGGPEMGNRPGAGGQGRRGGDQGGGGKNPRPGDNGIDTRNPAMGQGSGKDGDVGGGKGGGHDDGNKPDGGDLTPEEQKNIDDALNNANSNSNSNGNVSTDNDNKNSNSNSNTNANTNANKNENSNDNSNDNKKG